MTYLWSVHSKKLQYTTPPMNPIVSQNNESIRRRYKKLFGIQPLFSALPVERDADYSGGHERGYVADYGRQTLSAALQRGAGSCLVDRSAPGCVALVLPHVARPAARDSTANLPGVPAGARERYDCRYQGVTAREADRIAGADGKGRNARHC